MKGLKQILLLSAVIVWQGGISYDSYHSVRGDYRIVDMGWGQPLILEQRSTVCDSQGVMTTSWQRIDRDEYFASVLFSQAIRDMHMQLHPEVKLND